MHPIYQKYLEILLQQFQYDMDVMSQPWMYYTVVPIISYLVFYFVKWATLTAPLWVPFWMVINSMKGKRK